MIIARSKIIGLPLIELKTQSGLGQVFDLIIRKNNPAVAGFLVKTGNPFAKPRVVSVNDVTEIGTSAIIVNDAETVVNLDEVVRLKKAVQEGLTGIHQRVATKSGRRIGSVFDYLISSSDLTITKLYLRNIFAEKIIPVSAIIKFNGKKIIIFDDFELVESLPAVAPEAKTA